MGGGEPLVKVVIERRVLQGSGDGDLLQKVATVYVDGDEYRLLAPPKATGDPIEWLDQSSVRRPSLDSFGSEDIITGAYALLVRNSVREELQYSSSKTDATASSPYYHARLIVSGSPNAEVRFDLSLQELQNRVLEPYQNLRPIVLGGRTVQIEDLERLEVFKSSRPSSEFSGMAAGLARTGSPYWHHGEQDVTNVTDELIITPSVPGLPQSTDAIDLLCSRFHSVVKQLRARHGSRPTLDVSDEYDVQDLLHALLRIFFGDVRPEEWTPSYAGKSSRMDFLLPTEESVIETKKTRPGLTAKELGDRLIVDIARYRSHPRCKRLICFVYDPEGRVTNPKGIESDLGRTENDLEVRVIIEPKS